MTAAVAPYPLPAIRTDAVWDHDFTFEGEAFGSQPISLVLVSIGRPLHARRFDLGTGLSLSQGNRISVRLSAAQLTGLRAGEYAFQVQVGAGSAADTVLVGSVPVFTGLSAYLASGAPPLWDGIAGPAPVPSMVIGPPGPTRIIRAGAMRGAPGGPGKDGKDGPPGPTGPGADDPGDLTLIFENQLI